MSMRYVFFLLIFLCEHASAELIRVPGTRVTMDVPATFSLAPDFPGFISSGVQATISVAELPSSFVKANAVYDDIGLKRKGVEVTARDTFEQDGLRAILIEGEQLVLNRRVVKLMMLTGDVGESLMITATYYKKDEPKIGATLRTSLREARWNSSEPLDHFGGLGFRLEEIPGLSVATRASNSIIFTEEGRLPDRFYTGAMLVVGWSTGDVSTIKDRRRFAHRQFSTIQLLSEAEIENTEYAELDGRTAIEVTGVGQHKHLGFDLNAYQVIVIYDERYLMAQGFAGGDDSAAILDQFRTIMSSLSTN